MGLDFYPEGPHFSYSGFSYFRNNIAHYFKIPLVLSGYIWSSQTGDKLPFTFIDYDLDQIEFTDKHTFLELFLNHSDCDGQLTPEECKGISMLMDEYILQLEKDVKKMKSNYHKLFKTKKDYVFYLKKYGLPAIQWLQCWNNSNERNTIHKTIRLVLYSDNINKIYKACKKQFIINNLIDAAEYQLDKAKQFNKTLKTCVKYQCDLKFC